MFNVRYDWPYFENSTAARVAYSTAVELGRYRYRLPTQDYTAVLYDTSSKFCDSIERTSLYSWRHCFGLVLALALI